MVKLAIYQEEKMVLSSVAFVEDTLNHVAIIEMDSYERRKQMIISFAAIAEQMKVTNPISEIDKKEIQEMILMRFKRLSVNEIYYAFKLERFGELGEQNSHYNRFDVVYIGQVLQKYKDWKIKVRLDNNLAIAISKPSSVTEKEKQYWINRGLTECIEYFEEHREIMDGKTYVYQILYDDSFLQTNAEYKRRVYKDAVEAIEFEYQNKKPLNLEEKKRFKNIIANVHCKNNGLVKSKCFEISLLEFFRELTKNQAKLNDFKNKYLNK